MEKDLVSITWVDATEGSKSIDEIDLISPEEFLIERISYGKLYKENKYAYVLITTEDRGLIEYIAIPKNWAIKKEKRPTKK